MPWLGQVGDRNGKDTVSVMRTFYLCTLSLCLGARARVQLPEPSRRTRAKRVASRHTCLSSDGWPMGTPGMDHVWPSGNTPAKVMQLTEAEAAAPKTAGCQEFLMKVEHQKRPLRPGFR